MYEDKTFICKDCGEEFIFTVGEQEFYAEKGFQNQPVRCKACRDIRKNNTRGNDSSDGRRELHEAVCANCGGIARVPFVPKNDRPIYCSDCYQSQKQKQ